MNKMTKKIIPDLRFPEFVNNDNWTAHTLGEVADFRRGSFPQPYGLPEWYDDENGLPFIQVFDVDNNFRLKPKTKSKISKLASLQSVFIKKGTVIITIQGSIGRVAITQYDAYIDRTLLIFQRFHKEIDKYFFSYVLFLLFEIEKENAPGGIIKTITKEVLSDFLISIPSLFEQHKIANCLLSLDELITAQKEKLELLKNHKKGLMQNLFPQEGETVPKFRFPEFENDPHWVQKKLAEISVKIQDGTHFSPKSFDNGDFLYITSKNVKNGYLELSTAQFISTEEHENIYKRCDVRRGDVLLTKDGTIGQSCVNELTIPFSLLSSVAFIRLKTNFSNYFLYHLLISHIGQKEIESQIAGQALKRITLTKINNFSFAFPLIKEQQKIASCLSSLDDLISSQTDKIEKLQLHKKGLMQGLFPKIID